MAAPRKTISELASLIQTHAQTLEEGAKDIPGGDFSLTAGTPPKVLLPASLEGTRAELLEVISELQTRIQGPLGYITQIVLPIPSILAIVNVLYNFDIVSHVPLPSPSSSKTPEITYADLSQKCGLPIDDTRRVLQAATTFRIFEESVPDVSVRHNAISGAMAGIPGVMDYLGIGIDGQAPAALRLADSLHRFPGSGEPGHAAMMIMGRASKGIDPFDVEDPQQSWFDFIKDDEKVVSRFRRAMGLSTRVPEYSSEFFVENVPWDDTTCPETIVDIGGAGGDVCEAMLRRYPAIRKATILDLPEVIANVAPSEDVKERLEFAAYNFLTQPVEHKADAFLFRHIFHDWSDEYAVKIIRNLVPALKAGTTRIYISEVVLEDVNTGRVLKHQMQRGADLMMKLAFNGKERSKLGWEELFTAADTRFRIESIVKPVGANDSVIQVVLDS